MTLKPDTPRCGGKLHKRDGTCTLPAGWGTDHVGFGRCRKHWGNSATGVKAAENERLDTEARQVLARLDVPPVGDPLSELARVAGQVVAWKDQMAAKVNELTELRYSGQLGQEQLRSELLLWERALDRCVATLTAMAKLGIEERQMRLTERQAAIVNAVLRAALADIGLSPEQMEAARPAIARHLRLADERQRRALAPAGG